MIGDTFLDASSVVSAIPIAGHPANSICARIAFIGDKVIRQVKSCVTSRTLKHHRAAAP